MRQLFTCLIVSTALVGCSSASTNKVQDHISETPSTEFAIESAELIGTGQDPLFHNTTEVTFDITVPAYQSNELRLELVRGETVTSANWVGDEYWSANVALPAGAQNSLTVTFYDENGSVELAVVELEFTTGTNASETVTIEAHQFDWERFDTDGDGTSNLDELIAGNDPRLEESTPMNISESVEIIYLLSSFQLLEQELPNERPYNLSDFAFVPFTEENDSLGTSYNTNVDVDLNGNGSYSYSSYEHYFSENRSGTRTNSGSAIAWEGRFTTYDGDYSRSADFTSKVSIISQDTFEIVEELSEVYSGYYRDTWDVKSKLTGTRIEDTSYCKAIAGTVTYTRWTNRTNNSSFPASTVTTVTKAAGDQFWQVQYLNSDNELTEYLARELKVAGKASLASDRVQESAPATFKCDFVDINK